MLHVHCTCLFGGYWDGKNHGSDYGKFPALVGILSHNLPADAHLYIHDYAHVIQNIHKVGFIAALF